MSNLKAAISRLADERVAATQRAIDANIARGERIAAEIAEHVRDLDDAANDWHADAATRALTRLRAEYAAVVRETARLIGEVDGVRRAVA